MIEQFCCATWKWLVRVARINPVLTLRPNNRTPSDRETGREGTGTSYWRQRKVVTMASVHNIAKYFLMLAAGSEEDAGEAMTHLKLQKLLYYAQGFHLALNGGKPLFGDSIEAWKHGPIVNSIWQAYKERGGARIPPDENFEPEKGLSEKERELLNDVWNTYGQFSAWRLRNMTNDEAPWRNSYEADANRVIPHKAMVEYFSTQIE